MKLCKFFSTTNNSNIIKEKICESCQVKKLENKFVCGMCKTIRDIKPSQFLNKLNFFSVFNMKSGYKIDKHNLDHQYKELQKVIHPDKYALSDESVIKEAHDCSSYVLEAYHTLKNDYKRANYLLKLRGLECIEEGSHCINEKEFLEYLMDIQERIEEAESKEEVDKIKDEILIKIHDLNRELEKAFENEELHKVKDDLKSLKFHLTILQNIQNKIYVNRH